MRFKNERMRYRPTDSQVEAKEYEPSDKRIARRFYLFVGGVLLLGSSAFIAPFIEDSPTDAEADDTEDERQAEWLDSTGSMIVQIQIQTAYEMRELGEIELCQQAVDNLIDMHVVMAAAIDCTP